MIKTIIKTPYYPRTYTDEDISFCDYLVKQCRLTKFVAIEYTATYRRLINNIGLDHLLHDDNIEGMLSKIENYNEFSISAKTRYRKVVRIYREYSGVSA